MVNFAAKEGPMARPRLIFYSDEPMQDLASISLCLLDESAFCNDEIDSFEFHRGA
jgi:hypothetical protein